jgi:hypothetical protein
MYEAQKLADSECSQKCSSNRYKELVSYIQEMNGNVSEASQKINSYKEEIFIIKFIFTKINSTPIRSCTVFTQRHVGKSAVEEFVHSSSSITTETQWKFNAAEKFVTCTGKPPLLFFEEKSSYQNE